MKLNLDSVITKAMLAIAVVESGNDPQAYNEKEDAAGLYQLRPIYVRDVNRIDRLNHPELKSPQFTLEDRFSITQSAYMVRVYLRHWGGRERLSPSSEADWITKLARIHNGGPHGHKKDSTVGYGARVLELVTLERKEEHAKN